MGFTMAMRIQRRDLREGARLAWREINMHREAFRFVVASRLDLVSWAVLCKSVPFHVCVRDLSRVCVFVRIEKTSLRGTPTCGEWEL